MYKKLNKDQIANYIENYWKLAMKIHRKLMEIIRNYIGSCIGNYFSYQTKIIPEFKWVIM